MTKLMFALWGELAGLHSPEVHGRIEAAGGIRLQVNVADEHVRAGDADLDVRARHRRLRERVDGVDSAGDRRRRRAARRRRPGRRLGGRGTPADRATGGLGRLTARRAGNIAVLRRPAELTQEEWLHRWRVDHTPIAIATQATFGYLQNLVVARLTDETPEVSGIVEELFPTAGIDDMHAFYGSGGDDAELSVAAGPADGERGPDRCRPRPRPGADLALPLPAQGLTRADDLAVERRDDVAALAEVVRGAGVDRAAVVDRAR